MTEYNLAPAAYIRLDLSPAVLRSDVFQGGVADRRRVIVTDAHAYVFTDAQGGPEVTYTFELEDFTGDSRSGYTITATDGTVITVNRSQGCLCGSRLRGINPFPGVPLTH